MRLNTAKTCVVSYTRKTNFLSYDYQLCHAIITRTSSINDLGVFFDSKLHFHNHVDYHIIITSTDANKLERIQQKFTSICFIVFTLMLLIIILLP
jgi:hypothetical protein